MSVGLQIEFIGEKTIGIKEGQTILSAALQAGVPHFNACRGRAQCSTCRVLVVDGIENLSPVNEAEAELRKRIVCSPNTRLACQTTMKGGSVSLHRVIKDQTDVFVYVNKAEQQDEQQELGEEKELALFFLDIRNFTPFVETFLPFDVMHVMRRLFRIFKKVIDENNGKIVETAGDEIYAVFGLNVEIGIACKSSVTAAKTILVELEKFNDNYLKPNFNISFDVGIGIHAGKVIVGNVGLGVFNNLSVMGLPVNIASRLQAATKEINNSIAVSGEVVEQMSTPVEQPSTLINLKGIQGKQKVFLFGNSYDGKKE
jgi:adenylate cyclase